MLVPELFVYFREPHRRIPALEKRNVIAAAPVTIAPVDHHHIELRHILVSSVLDEARSLARRGIVPATNPPSRRRLGRRFIRRHAFREHTQVITIAHTISTE